MSEPKIRITNQRLLSEGGPAMWNGQRVRILQFAEPPDFEYMRIRTVDGRELIVPDREVTEAPRFAPRSPRPRREAPPETLNGVEVFMLALAMLLTGFFIGVLIPILALTQ